MMLKAYITEFCAAAAARGLKDLRFHIEHSASRSAGVSGGELEKLELSDGCRLFVEGSAEGFGGGVFVEALSPALAEEHVRLLWENALACRRSALPHAPIAAPEPEDAGDFAPLELLTERLREAEAAALAVDSRVEVLSCGFHERLGTITLADGQGNAMTDPLGCGHFHIELIAREGARTLLGGRSVALRRGELPALAPIARKAAEEVISRLSAASCPTGHSAVVLDGHVVCELLDAFSPAFFGRNVQHHMSVLEGRLGQRTAGENITLEEDPTLPGGLRPRRFDDEGVPTSRKTILDRGVLRTYLYDQRGAAQAGEAPGGNGFCHSVSEEASTGYTNLVLRAGERTQEELLAEMGEGLLITRVSGVFAGAHPTTGEFSLIARGVRVRDGQRREAVNQITIAGDFFAMLERVLGVGSDGQWMRGACGSVCAPSLYVKDLAVSGEEQA